MKKLIYVLLLTFSCGTMAQAGGDPVKKFYRKYKKGDQVFNISLPGVLTRTGIGIARLFTRDEAAKAGLKLAKKMRGIRVLVDNGYQVRKSDAKALVNNLRAQKKMEILTSFRGHGEQTWVMGQIKGEKVKKIVVITFSKDRFTMVAAKSRMKIKDLNRLIKELQRGQEKKQNEQWPEA